jgi:hypothetical protein
VGHEDLRHLQERKKSTGNYVRGMRVINGIVDVEESRVRGLEEDGAEDV